MNPWSALGWTLIPLVTVTTVYVALVACSEALNLWRRL